MTHIDLNKFPTVEKVHGFLKYDPFTEFPSLANLGDISERIYGCTRFVFEKADKKYPNWSENANLRAFLNEFSSLNEMLKKSSQPLLRKISIEKIDYPILHFLKLLRNVNFHIKSITGGNTSFQATIINKTTNKRVGEEITITLYFITNCDFTLFQNANDIRHYELVDIQKTIEWVDAKQKEHGIYYVFEAALRQYCKLIDSTVANKKYNAYRS